MQSDDVNSLQSDEPEEPVKLREPMPLDDEMDITPMIDITFLLLIFFLVASKMSRTEQIELPMATHGSAIVEKDSTILVLKRGSGDVCSVARPGGNSFSNDIEQQEAEIAEYVAQGLDQGKTEIIIKSEGSVRFGEVDRIKRAVSQVLDEGTLIHIGVKQQN